MKRADWAGAVLAESDDVVMVEGNAYFSEAAIWRERVAFWRGVTLLDV